MMDPFQTRKIPSYSLLDAAEPIDLADAERKTDPAMAEALAASAKDRATITVLSGVNAGQVFALDGIAHVLGRASDADIWIEDGGVSRRHARISVQEGGKFLLEDLGSTNGTFLGAQRIERAEVRPGDRIQVGPHVTLRFQITDDAEEELQRRLYESSTRDALTRLYNRKYLNERFAAEIADARRHGTQLALLMMDLDDFKSVNDTYGHLAGDLVLRLVAAQVHRLVRVEDIVARWGGEELVVLARATAQEDAAHLAERIRAAITTLDLPVRTDTTIAVTVSVGVASLAETAADGGPNEVLALADARLYRAKAAGKNRVCRDGEAVLTRPTAP